MTSEIRNPKSEIPPDLAPATQTELCRWVGENAGGPTRAFYPVGGRTGLHFGNAERPAGLTLAMTDLTKVIDYPARDMTITVEAGIRIDELAKVLATERQRLPIDVPQRARATLGGVIAANPSGSRRFGLGTMRDYLIGVSAIDASGRLFKAGGRVVKNVAGYDLCKMLVGSLGTLAIITQVTLKLRPLPESTRLLWCSFDHLAAVEQSLARLTTSAARPVAIDLLDPRAANAVVAEAELQLPTHRPVVCLGVEGTAHETAWQIETLKAELAPQSPNSLNEVADGDAPALWSALTEFQVSSDDPLTFEASLLPSKTVAFFELAMKAGCALQVHAGNGIVYGHLPDSIASAAAARAALDPLRASAERCGGSLVVEHCDDAWKPDLSLFGHPQPSWPWMRKLKDQLDPKGLLNPHLRWE